MLLSEDSDKGSLGVAGGVVPRVPNLLPEPNARQIDEHELTGHAL